MFMIVNIANEFINVRRIMYFVDVPLNKSFYKIQILYNYVKLIDLLLFFNANEFKYIFVLILNYFQTLAM